ncbi:MAG: hypothetical protein GY703_17180 [Gammaproteobacteria bacterium]|nr:hypothetical protein [Gammaproteobacteria bacterium]
MSISVVRKESGVAKGSITCFWKPGYLPAILFLLLVSGAAGAQRPVSPEIEQTFNYLALQQKGDGSFEVVAPIASTFHLTSRISQSLYTSFPDSDTFSRAQSFLLTEQVDSVEGRARRLFISEFPEQSSEVLDAQNPDGGFGAEAGFSSNVLDTAFSLLAMKAWGAPVGIVARQVDIPPGESHIATLEIPADTGRYHRIGDTD